MGYHACINISGKGARIMKDITSYNAMRMSMMMRRSLPRLLQRHA